MSNNLSNPHQPADLAKAPERRPTLIAAWPGMGNVGVIAAATLVHELKMQQVAELSPGMHFDPQGVAVEDGLIAPVRMPRSVLYQWKEAPEGKGLLVFLAESQPTSDSLGYARAVLDKAGEFNVGRVFTFAAVATQMHPKADSHVGAAATDDVTLAQMRRLELNILEDGQVGGMNGLLMGAAAERHLPGACLLGEIPGFATALPSPRAAKALLEAFSVLHGVEVNLEPLTEHARIIEKTLLGILKDSRAALNDRSDTADEPDAPEHRTNAAPSQHPGKQPSPGPARAAKRKLDRTAVARIEGLFEEAQKDRARAGALKLELDRLGVFDLCENRFLDLFKPAG